MAGAISMQILIRFFDALRKPWSGPRRSIRRINGTFGLVVGNGLRILSTALLFVVQHVAALGAIGFFALFSVHVWNEAQRDKVEITLAPAPEAMEAMGYSGSVLAGKIRDGVDRIYRDAHRPIPFATEEKGEIFPLIDEAPAYLFSSVMPEPTFDFAMSWARRFVGVTHTTVAGDVICSDEDCAKAAGVWLSIGVRGAGQEGWTHREELSDDVGMETAIDRIALRIVETFDPIAAARYHFRTRDFEKTERLAIIGRQKLPDRAVAAEFLLIASAIEEEDFDFARENLEPLLASDRPEIRARALINSSLLDARRARIRSGEGVASLRKQLEGPIAALREAAEMGIKSDTAGADIPAIAYANIGVNLLKTFDHNDAEQGCAVLQEAQAAFEQSIMFDATDPMPRYYLGTIERRQCDFRGATRRYYEALALDPDYSSALRGLGFAYRRAALQASSDRMCEPDRVAAVERDSEGQKALLERAVSAYERALELPRSRHITHMNLAVALIDLGKTGEAGAHLRRSLEISPGYDRAHFYLGWVDMCDCRFDAALANLEAAQNRPSSSTTDQQRLRQVYEILLQLRDRAAVAGQPLRDDDYWRSVETELAGINVDGEGPDECQIFPPALQCDRICAAQPASRQRAYGR